MNPVFSFSLEKCAKFDPHYHKIVFGSKSSRKKKRRIQENSHLIWPRPATEERSLEIFSASDNAATAAIKAYDGASSEE